jgi:hypothetical protein
MVLGVNEHHAPNISQGHPPSCIPYHMKGLIDEEIHEPTEISHGDRPRNNPSEWHILRKEQNV